MTVSAMTTALLLAVSPVAPSDRDVLIPAPIAVTAALAPADSAGPGAMDPEGEAPTSGAEIIVTAQPRVPGDPLIEVNAASFEATQAVDRAFVRPVAMAYEKAMPKPIRSGIRNFLNNVEEPIVFLNYLLQLKPGKAFETVGRFAINTTIGAAGLFDMAKRRPFNLPYRPNGFGNTMGYYGVKTGAFLYLPLIGPTTVRDFVGLTLDRLVMPLAVGKPFNKPYYSIPTSILGALDERIERDAQIQKMHEESGQPYASNREEYLRSRQAEIDALHGRVVVVPPPVVDVPVVEPK